jgi:hypothetical protein
MNREWWSLIRLMSNVKSTLKSYQELLSCGKILTEGDPNLSISDKFGAPPWSTAQRTVLFDRFPSFLLKSANSTAIRILPFKRLKANFS